MRVVTFSIESWQAKEPFQITGYTFSDATVLIVAVTENGVTGRGEASGIYYERETAETMLAQAESVRGAIESGIDVQELQHLLPRGGARNAIDCALWDLQTKLTGKSIWELTGIEPKRVITVNTVGVDTPVKMAAKALELDTPKIKVKLDGEIPLERIQAVRNARPDAEIVVDANQGWSFEQLVELAPKFKALDIAMIEQPLPRGADEALEYYDSPIVLCADESCLDTSELEQAARRYQMISAKLDKTGGLTEALELARQVRARGLKLMIGCMGGTSLAMAPGFVVAQLCEFVDLDGALFYKYDRESPMSYESGVVTKPVTGLWG